MTELGFFGKTTVDDVTSTARAFTNAGPSQVFVVRADRKVHLLRTTDGDAAAATEENGFLLLADEPAQFSLEVGGSLSYVLAAGETDGSIRITEAN